MADKDKTPAAGLLMKAHAAKKIDPFKWFEVSVGKLKVKVATDAWKSTLEGQDGVRLPVTYNEAITICREKEWVMPTKSIADAMWKAAKFPLLAVTLDSSDETKMVSVGWTLKFHEGVKERLEGKTPGATDLVFGAWKLWILDPFLTTAEKRFAGKAAVNYGFWKKNGSVWQSPGGRHPATYTDYSQLFQPVERKAKGPKGEVDLLDYIQDEENVPKEYLDPYRKRPASP
jgi:hypothetical protein